MKNLVFLLEEPSAKDLLKGLLPRLIPENYNVRYLVFEGKQDLEKQLVRKLRAWLAPDTLFVVMRDQDAAECRDVKQRLTALVKEAKRDNSLVRVVCRELESWVLGDLQAVAQAFNQPRLGLQAQRERYRNPDKLRHPIDELRRILPDYQKRDGARRVGTCLDPARNQSESFQSFCRGLRRLVAERT